MHLPCLPVHAHIRRNDSGVRGGISVFAGDGISMWERRLVGGNHLELPSVDKGPCISWKTRGVYYQFLLHRCSVRYVSTQVDRDREHVTRGDCVGGKILERVVMLLFGRRVAT